MVLSRKRLAEDVNLSTAYIGQIERGERSLTLENLAAVANRLGVTIDYLLVHREVWQALFCQMVRCYLSQSQITR